VVLHRQRADAQGFADLLVALPLSHPLQHLAFARGDGHAARLAAWCRRRARRLLKIALNAKDTQIGGVQVRHHQIQVRTELWRRPRARTGEDEQAFNLARPLRPGHAMNEQMTQARIAQRRNVGLQGLRAFGIQEQHAGSAVSLHPAPRDTGHQG